MDDTRYARARTLSPRRRARDWRLAAVLVLTIAAFALLSRSWLTERLEAWTFDLRVWSLHKVRSAGWAKRLILPQRKTQELVVVALDEESLTRMGERYPLPRRHLARLIDRLNTAGARVIALDMFLQGKSSDPADDRMLAASIARSGRVIFGQRWLRQGRDVYTKPNDPFFATGMLGEATILFLPGADQLIRHCYLTHAIDGRTLPSLALLSVIHHWKLKSSQVSLPEPGVASDLVLSHAPEGRSDRARVDVAVEPSGALLVDLAGAELPFRMVGVWELDEALRKDPELVRNKLVLVGSTASASQDQHAVPVAYGDQTLVAGVLVHAYAIKDLLTSSPFRRAPAGLDVLLIVAMGVLTTGVCLMASPRRVASRLLVFLGAYLLLAWWLLVAHGYWLACVMPVGVAGTLFVEVVCMTALGGRQASTSRTAWTDSEDEIDPELEDRLTRVRSLLSLGAGQVVQELQSQLPAHSAATPPEISWGLAMAFLAQGQVQLALPHVTALDSAMLPLEELYELAVALEEAGALPEAAQILRWIQARDLAFRDVMVWLYELEKRDRQVPEELRRALCGRFGDLGFLGAGGMARVYSGRDHRTGKHVAIKVPDADLMERIDARRRFIREMKTLTQVSHPTIIRIHDVNTEGLIYYTMELLEGESLRSLLEREHHCSLDRALALLEPIASALAHLHERGIVHRDVKPENILMDAEGRPRLTDFGIAFLEGQTRLTRTSAYAGTPAYMAPELLHGEDPTPQADVYAFGLTLYEAIAGANPYFSSPAVRKLLEEPPPLTDVAPDIAPALARLVAACLERDPSLRPADGGRLLEQVRMLFVRAGGDS